MLHSRRLLAVWLVLCFATAASGWLGFETLLAGFGRVGALLSVASLKGVFVIRDFMDLRNAPAVWRILPIIWLVLVSGIIIAGYWAGENAFN